MQVRRFDVVVAGHTNDDFEAALEEATARMRAGCVAGKDSRTGGGFYFSSTTAVDESALPSGMDLEVSHG